MSLILRYPGYGDAGSEIDNNLAVATLRWFATTRTADDHGW